MKNILYLVGLWAGLLGLPFLSQASADTFGSGANQFTIDFVRIGSPGNLPDDPPNPAGAVPYEYRIGKYEVSEQMIHKANALSALAGAPLGITIDARGPDFPATSVTWFEAARFVNWLNESTGHPVAYKFDDMGDFQLWDPLDPGYDPANRYRNSRAIYFLPSVDEWHKAAYYDPAADHYWDYPTGTDAVPDGIDFVGDTLFDAVFDDGGNQLGPNVITNVGLASPYGTFGQGGNVYEWDETAFDRINDHPSDQRRVSGGSWGSIYTVLNAANTLIGTAPHAEFGSVGIRIASIVPEPDAMMLLFVAVLASQAIIVRHQRH